MKALPWNATRYVLDLIVMLSPSLALNFSQLSIWSVCIKPHTFEQPIYFNGATHYGLKIAILIKH